MDRAREAHLGASARVERRAVSPRDAILGAGSAVREAVMACIVLESCRASGALCEMDGPEARSTADGRRGAVVRRDASSARAGRNFADAKLFQTVCPFANVRRDANPMRPVV